MRGNKRYSRHTTPRPRYRSVVLLLSLALVVSQSIGIIAAHALDPSKVSAWGFSGAATISTGDSADEGQGGGGGGTRSRDASTSASPQPIDGSATEQSVTVEDSAGPRTTTLEVQPTLETDNPTCQTLTQSDHEFRIDAPDDEGDFDDPESELVVTISGLNDPDGFFDWSSNLGIDAVFAKGGPGGDLYEYDDATADTDLHPPINGNTGKPYGISHISFCWNDEPDLTITKAASSQSVAFGSAFTYTITVTNTGDTQATGVTVTDNLADSLTGVSASFDVDPGSAGGTGNCDVGAGNTVTCPGTGQGSITLAADDGNTIGAEPDVVVVTINATAPRDSCPTLTNTATVDSDQTSPQASNQVTVTVTGCAPGLTITKQGPASVGQGGQITYTVTVQNTGNEEASGVVVTDDLDDSLSNVSASFVTPDTEGAVDCTVATTPKNLVTCVIGTLGADDAATVTINATAPTGVCPTITNQASVTTFDGEGPTITSNIVTTTVTGCLPPPPPPPSPIGINIDKNGPALAHVGDTVTYTSAVTLTTSTSLSNITVVDPICSAAPTLVSQTGGDQDTTLEPGETWNFSCTHVVTASDQDPLPNTASVTGTASDGRNTSDTDSHVVDIIHPAIRIVKRADPTSVSPGETVTYTYRVTNTGDVTLFDVEVTDNKLGDICTIAQLDVGQTETCTATFRVPDRAGPVDNVGVAEGEDVTGFSVRDQDDASVDIVLGTTVTPPPTTTPPSGVAFTGAAGVIPLAGLALLLLFAGSGILFLTRRREDGSEA